MRVVIAMDSFKGSLSSIEAGEAVAVGIRKSGIKEVEDITIKPLADGGEGTTLALTTGMNGNLQQVTVTGPMGKNVICEYGIIEGTQTAILEMAGAAGLTLLAREERNPLLTTTYGVGEVIKDAMNKGCRHFLVGIGGSATNDGGAGMLQALGFDLLDKDNNPIGFGAKGLEKLEKIQRSKVLPELAECDFRIACDVENPLCGQFGCSTVFGPQKGANPDTIIQMDKCLKNYAEICEKEMHVAPDSISNAKGSGAAGGLGFAFRAFLNATLEPGIKIVIEETGLEDVIRNADLVVTGEGKLDGQTAMGKAPVGIARIAKKYGKKVIAFAGSVTEEACICNQKGIDSFFPILRSITNLENAMEKDTARTNLILTVEQVFRLLG